MNKQKNIFKNIIGYDDIKKTLTRLVDVLNNKEKYKKLGCTIPHGLLLCGPPGTGKTTFCSAILKAMNDRKTFIIRKSKSDGDFMDYIEKVFNKAVKEKPSIVLLDDLDKFSEEKGKKNQEEFVIVQTMLDMVKNEDVFVVATANDKYVLPDSLLRSGRFDIKINLENPSEEDSFKIIGYYLKKKKIKEDVNISNISQILVGLSCADLEKVCNQAGMYAGFLNKEAIGMDELIRAALEEKYETNIEDLNKEDKYSLTTAYHEAAHALIASLLEPKSVSFVTISKNDSGTRGITIYHNNEYYFEDIEFRINRIKSLLAGKAAIEIVFNKCCAGSSSDIDRAYRVARSLVDDCCLNGFESKVQYNESEQTLKNRDEATSKILSEYYSEVKTMIKCNRPLLDALAKELNERKILFAGEIEEIVSRYKPK